MSDEEKRAEETETVVRLTKENIAKFAEAMRDLGMTCETVEEALKELRL